MNIYVGNLNYKVRDEDLKEIFEEYGEVTSAKVLQDKQTGKSKGFGFVEMANDEEAKRAVNELHEAELMGRKMVVNEARPMEKKSFGGGGNNNYRK